MDFHSIQQNHRASQRSIQSIHFCLSVQKLLCCPRLSLYSPPGALSAQVQPVELYCNLNCVHEVHILYTFLQHHDSASSRRTAQCAQVKPAGRNGAPSFKLTCVSRPSAGEEETRRCSRHQDRLHAAAESLATISRSACYLHQKRTTQRLPVFHGDRRTISRVFLI